MKAMLLLLLFLPVLAGGFVAAEDPGSLTYGRLFSCSGGEDALRLWLFVAEDEAATCKELAPGRFECRNESGARAYGTCETGCVQTEGYSGCFAFGESEWQEIRDHLPTRPVFAVIGRTAAGAIRERCLLSPAREDSQCWISTAGRSVTGAACGKVVEGRFGEMTRTAMVNLDVYGSHCDCADLELDSLDQRNCSRSPIHGSYTNGPRQPRAVGEQ